MVLIYIPSKRKMSNIDKWMRKTKALAVADISE